MTILIENIDDVRKREGIDDVVLRNEIVRLKAGDQVRLSVSSDGRQFEMLAVRITSLKGNAIRGKLLDKPRSRGLGTLAPGSAMKFAASQVHSIVDGKPACDGVSCDRPRAEKDVDDSDNGSRFGPLAARTSPKPPPSRSMVRPGQKRPASDHARKSRRSLRVEGNPSRYFVAVPAELSSELHRYLKSNRVWSSPPHPYLTDVDCIELDRKINVERVQALLKAWR
ncbi:MAG TPA: hypothetical protein VHR72_07875 [Gemmataceae bacterium]|jgi:hypothetical protein|nr:hypothetical protein [Gemmataceae bacterium]